MSCPTRRRASLFTRFERLLALRDRIARLFCPPDIETHRSTRLAVEAMEERLVPDSRPLPNPAIFAGAGYGHTPDVKAYNAETGVLKFSIAAYTSSFTGGVRVGTGDFNGDGIPDVVTAPGPGMAPIIEVFNGTTGTQLTSAVGSFLAYGTSVTGGVYVAAADVDGDGHADIVTSAVTTLGPRIKAFSGVTGDKIADFFVSGMASGNGLTIAAADVTGDGKAEVVVGSGTGGNGWVRTYDLLTGSITPGPLGSFQAFGTSYTGGVYVGSDALAGDVNGDGKVDLAVGTRGANLSHVKVIDGVTGSVLQNFLPFGTGVSGGARVGLSYVNNDSHADIVVGIGPGNTNEVRVFDGVTCAQLASPQGDYSPFGTDSVGIFVASSNDPLNPVVSYDTPPGTVILGQTSRVVVRVMGRQFPTPLQPTGTVTISATKTPSGPTYTLGTASIAGDGSGWQATAAFVFNSVPLGTYTFTASYSGDANFTIGSAPGSLGVTSPGSGTPNDQPAGGSSGGGSSGGGGGGIGGGGGSGGGGNGGGIIGGLVGDSGSDCSCSGPVSSASGQAGAAGPGRSMSGVDYATGTLQVTRSDLSSSGYGTPFGQDWSWTNASGYADGTAGSGATATQMPHLVQVSGNTVVSMVSNGQTARFYDLYGGAYHARYGDGTGITSGSGHFTVTDSTGQVFTFYDFSGGTPTGRAGKLISITDANGDTTSVTSWDGSGRVTEVQRVSGTGASALTESFLSTYVSSGTNAGLLDTVTQREQVGTGSWTTVRSTAYTYYDGVTGPGLAHELKTAIVKDASGNALDTSYYRYYTSGTGTSGNMKYAFGADAYNRLTAALGTSLDSLTDAQVDDYADKYLEYDTSGRVTKVVDAAAGCSVCSGGQGEFDYSYSTNSSAGLRLTNAWANKTIETLPDGSTNTVYTNAFGQVMLTVFTDSASNKWLNYTRYDDTGRVILQAGPSTVTGFSESNADLVGYSSGNASYLDDSNGIVTAYTYATSTTATTSTAGDAAGYLKEVDIQHGETGTAIPQSSMTYIQRNSFFFPASSTIYRNDNGTGGETTSMSYTWQGTTAQPESITTTLPTVTTAENGPNSATSTITFFDSFGRPVWTKDPAGFINYTAYDTVTGAVVKTIADVNTANTGDFSNLPSGWTTPTGGGLHLITTYEVDSLGRVTKSTSPEGRIDYTVYNDANHEVRTYSGWDTTNNVPTGPTTVSRYDTAGGYTESLTMTATPTVSSGRPTGTESISQVQSLSRDYTNAAGQMVQSDSYFDLSGLTYSTSTSFGTQNVNFYRTLYQYDDHGQLNKTTTPLGTIYRTVYDDLGREVSQWVGTDDTPTTGFWSPTNLTGTNTVEVSSTEYDGGGVGDGNVTKVTEYPGGGATNRVTQTWFDWRDRPVATKQGVEASESTSVNRPLVYTDYDNLGEVTKTRVYDADTVTPTITSGVPQPLSSSLLQAQSTTSYDELGRVYHTDTYSVDPSTGSVGSNTLHSDTWYDARGQVIKQADPGGIVTKNVYDGAGRTTTTYLTDGGGDSGYSDADDVTGDTVLEQSETTYSADGLPIATVDRQRFHNASGTGELGSPTSGIGARVSYTGSYYDASSGRATATVDVGTNGGTAWTRPGSVPSRSDTVLVTSYNYAADAVQTVTLTGSPTGGTFTLTFGGQTTSNIAYNASTATVDTTLEALTSIGSGNVVVTTAPGGGWQVRFAGTLAGKYQLKLTASGAGLTGGTSPNVAIATVSAGGDTGAVVDTTDPAGLVSRTYADAAGRTTQTIEDFTDGAITDSSNKTTLFTYNAAGMTSLTAALTGGGVQTTAYVYGVTQGSGSKLDSDDIVGITQWPDPTTGAASSSQQDVNTVDALGDALTATDRNGSIHTLTYDVLGRLVSDAVTTLGSGVDGSVRRIETAYDGQGNPYLITSYDAASGGSVVNQVQRAYNGLGQMITEWQSASGTVNTSTSPKVQYAYSEMPSGANHSRLTSITYPSGYVLTFNYSSGLNDSISRLSSLSDSTGSLESYDYLGLGTVVRRAHSQPGLDLTYIAASGTGDAGDQYVGLDRFGRVVDQLWKTSSATTDELQYGYDRDSNRLWRDNQVNSAFGELYAYDGLNQLTSFDRGTLNGTKTGLTGSASRSQDWDYDALGNFDSVTTNGTAQTRSANAQNEITAISGATTPTYDANGNMTGDETGRQFVYDAWNRLVMVKNSGGTTLESFSYDALNRRVTNTVSSTTTTLFYSSQWQVLEEKVGSNTAKRYVWSPVYVDAMILRDRDTDGNGTLDERLWVQQDANWNVTALVNGSGTVVERYVYDPYGMQTTYDATYGTRVSSLFLWTYFWEGKYFDPVSNMYGSRRRDYNADLGRFATNDPLGRFTSDLNYYRGLADSPVNNTDSNGLQINVNTLEKFLNWYKQNQDTSWTKLLPNCPCKLRKVVTVTTRINRCRDEYVRQVITYTRFENPDPSVWGNPGSLQLWFFSNIYPRVDFHPGASYDMRSKYTYDGHAQQCTYDAKGDLITNGPGAGTPDFAPAGTSAHQTADVDPYLWALDLDGGTPGTYVFMYLAVRPPNNGNHCSRNPPPRISIPDYSYHGGGIIEIHDHKQHLPWRDLP